LLHRVFYGWTWKRGGKQTVGEHSVDVEAVGGAGLIVGAAAHVRAQLPGRAVVDHPRVATADLIYRITSKHNKPL